MNLLDYLVPFALALGLLILLVGLQMGLSLFLRPDDPFALAPGGYPCHTVRSSEAFVAMAEQGLACCLIPELQIRQQLAQGLLLDLSPDNHLIERLYWHRWVLERGLHKQISLRLIEQGRRALQPR